MTEGDHRSGRKLAALAMATWLAFTVLVAPVGATTTGVVAAGNEAVVSGNVVYQTDSGATVTDTTGADVSGNPFDDSGTLTLPGLTVSADDNAAVTVDQRTGTYTKLSAIDASSADITVDPDDKQAVVIESGLDTLEFASVDFDASNSGTDFTYDAGSAADLTVRATGLDEGTTVEAITADGDTLGSADVDASGDLTLTGLTSGTFDVDLEDTSTRSSGVDDSTPPTAEAGPNMTVETDDLVAFDGDKSTDNLGIDRYEWDFDGDGDAEHIGSYGYHRYDTAGTYAAELQVEDKGENTDTDTLTVTVVEDLDSVSTDNATTTNTTETETTTTTTDTETTTGPTMTATTTEKTTTTETETTGTTTVPPTTTETTTTASADGTTDGRTEASTTDRSTLPSTTLIDDETAAQGETATRGETGTATTTGSGPGFGVVVALLAVLLALLGRR